MCVTGLDVVDISRHLTRGDQERSRVVNVKGITGNAGKTVAPTVQLFSPDHQSVLSSAILHTRQVYPATFPDSNQTGQRAESSPKE